MTRLRFLPRQPENQEVELLVLALLGLTGNAEVFRRGRVCVYVCVCVSACVCVCLCVCVCVCMWTVAHC